MKTLPIVLAVVPFFTCGAAEAAGQRPAADDQDCAAPQARFTAEELLKHAHPEAVHHAVPLPDDENAYPVWSEAGRKLNEINGTDYPRWLLDHRNPNKPLPEGQQRQALYDRLERHKPVLELVDRAAARQRFQLPPYSDDVNLGSSGALAKLKVDRARLRAGQGDWTGALADLGDVIHVGRGLARGEGVLVYWAFGNAVHSEGLTAMQALARNPRTPDEVVAKLRSMLPPPTDLCEEWATVLRVEFTSFFVPNLAAFYPSDEKLEEKLRELRREHPCSLDPADAVRSASQQVRDDIAACHLPWAGISDYVEERGRAVSCTERLFEVLQASADCTTPEDPFVKGLVAATKNRHVRRVFINEAYWRATRVALSIESHRRRHGKFPRSLADLDWTDGDATTIDPFSGEAFRYDASRGLLWSVGENGEDDGGRSRWASDPDDATKETRRADDIAWKLTPSSW